MLTHNFHIVKLMLTDGRGERGTTHKRHKACVIRATSAYSNIRPARWLNHTVKQNIYPAFGLLITYDSLFFPLLVYTVFFEKIVGDIKSHILGASAAISTIKKTIAL
ncbi:MAG: hypothetical protein JWQ66_2423 [Mucilaginibacter sp.]|nr:hypothetical protein [Mucilaginibacter sp.]